MKLSSLPLNSHAKDKLLRLVKERYDAETDILTIVSERCPLRKQNLDYAMYLLNVLVSESWVLYDAKIIACANKAVIDTSSRYVEKRAVGE